MQSELNLPPSLDIVRDVAQKISAHVLRTPTVQWPVLSTDAAHRQTLWVKLELLQRTGSFKPRGAVNAVLKLLDAHAHDNNVGQFPGITAFSAGNHAIAAAYAAHRLGTSAKVVMPRTANNFRVAQVEALGAQVVMGDTISDLMDIVKQISHDEGRHLVHPFEGQHVVQGTATIALELFEDIPDLEAVVVPVGGGGLISGIASAIKQIRPQCQVFGVEPSGASGMKQSLSERSPRSHVKVDTIADSLGAPMHTPYAFSLVQQFVDDMVVVSDEELRQGMRQMFSELKLAVEPACAASLAALNGPLADRLYGKRTALIACGSNIDLATYLKLIG